MTGQLDKEVATVRDLRLLARTRIAARLTVLREPIAVGVPIGRSGLVDSGVAPAGGRASHTGHLNALAIRRVEQHDPSAFARGHALQGVAAAQHQRVRHPGAVCVALGKVDHAKRHIAAKHRGTRGHLGGAGLVAQSLPHMGLIGQQFFKRKAAHQARCHVASDGSCLNGNGAAATTRVVQGQALLNAANRGRGAGCFTRGADQGHAPPTGGQHGRGQGFFQRRITFVHAPAAFEQGFARGVDVQRHVVAGEVGVQAHIGPLGVDAGALTAFGTEAIGHRVFDAQGGKVQAFERAVLGRDLDFEVVLWCEPSLPRHRMGTSVHIVFMPIRGVRELHQHPHGQAAVQVELHGHAP